MGSNNSPSPALDVAKKLAQGADGITILPNGVKVRINPVGAALISDVTSKIKDPEVPLWPNADKPDREGKPRMEANPDDPHYAVLLEEANQKRAIAMIDTMVMFGVELVDGVPDDDAWVKKLRFMEKRGMLDLSGYDLDDPFDREFLYKRYVLVDNNVVGLITDASGLSSEDVKRAEESFRGK